MSEQTLAAPDVSVQGVVGHFGVTRSTLYRLLGRVSDKVVAGDRGE